VSPDGRLVWEATYSGHGGNEDYPAAIAADAQGGVYVTGSTAVERDPRAPRAVVTLAFDSRGRIVWEARYARPGSLFYRPSDLLVDSAGDVHVFVNAVSTSESVDLLLKYDRMGRLVWETEVAQLAAYQLDPQLAFHPSGDVIAVFDASYPGPCFDWPRTTVVRVTATEIPSAPFLRGEVTGDGKIDVADSICILNLLFAPESGPCEVEDCLDALDANDDGAVGLGDAVNLLMHLFAGGPEPAPPGPTACGVDRTEDWSAAGFDLGCDAHPACEEAPAAR